MLNSDTPQKSQIRKEPLGSGYSIFVTDEHHFSTDTILLANFCAPKKHEKAVELGAGCGTISMLWARDRVPEHIYAVEIQPEACRLMEQSVALNGEQDRISVINADMRALKGTVPFGNADLVACNPPYKLEGSGLVNPNDAHKLARHELSCTAEDVVRTAASLLRFGGRFCMCQRPERLTDIMCIMRNNSIEPKRLRFVQQRQSKEPKLFLIEGKKGAHTGGLVVMPTLFIEDSSGGFSQEMLSVYGIYKDGRIQSEFKGKQNKG